MSKVPGSTDEVRSYDPIDDQLTSVDDLDVYLRRQPMVTQDGIT